VWHSESDRQRLRGRKTQTSWPVYHDRPVLRQGGCPSGSCANRYDFSPLISTYDMKFINNICILLRFMKRLTVNTAMTCLKPLEDCDAQ
jgi:hypothetical protein